MMLPVVAFLAESKHVTGEGGEWAGVECAPAL
jgi:hypothetical protein